MCAEEKIEQVLVEFPEDDRRSRGCESQKDLNGGRYRSNASLRIADRGAVKIRNGNAADEMAGHIQWRK